MGTVPKSCAEDVNSSLKQLNNLIESLTTSGKPKLDDAGMKDLKKICKLVPVNTSLYDAHPHHSL